jgi:hypothetical protein
VALLLRIFLLLAFLLPGYFMARCLREKLWAPSAFVFSLVVLFHLVFWLGVFGVLIQFWTVAALMSTVSATTYWISPISPQASREEKTPWTALERTLLACSAAIGAILLVHSFRAPFFGPDTWFRWDFLARRILELGRFNFYPPIHPADLKTYFFVDGIPPMVAIEHWWLYAAVGNFGANLICLLVAAEFFCTLAFTYKLAEAVSSRRAGVFAVAILAASPLFFDALFFSQETGLTALSIAAMLYFLAARPEIDASAAVSAGMAAALCALAREYGWIALILGLLALAWRRASVRQIFVFGATAIAFATPWYVRNWMVAGNPFYSLPFLGLAVNPVHAGIMRSYIDIVRRYYPWGSALVLIGTGAILQVFAGLPGAVLQFRRNGYLLVSTLLLAGIWYVSALYTSGGTITTLRVLSPALVLLSVTAASLIDRYWRRRMMPLLMACLFWSALQGVYFPHNLLAAQADGWWTKPFPLGAIPEEFQIRDQFVKAFPKGYRLLSDSAYLHAALYGTGIEVVPIWSPEVSFLFSASPTEADQRLAALHIGAVVWYPQSWNGPYLEKTSGFFGSLNRWTVRAKSGGFVILTPPTSAR